MSNYGADTDTDRYYEYLDETYAADQETFEQWAYENDLNPTEDEVLDAWPDARAALEQEEYVAAMEAQAEDFMAEMMRDYEREGGGYLY